MGAYLGRRVVPQLLPSLVVRSSKTCLFILNFLSAEPSYFYPTAGLFYKRVYQGCFIKAFFAENFGFINSSAPAEVSQFKKSAQKSINLHEKYVCT